MAAPTEPEPERDRAGPGAGADRAMWHTSSPGSSHRFKVAGPAPVATTAASPTARLKRPAASSDTQCWATA